MFRLIELVEKFYRDEYMDLVFYFRLVKVEKDERIKVEFQRFVQIEFEYVSFWYEFFKRRGVKLEKLKIGCFYFILVFVFRRVFGVGVVIFFFEMGERDVVKKYYRFLIEYFLEMSEDERERFKSVILDEFEYEKFFREEEKIFYIENICDLVLGMNDGFVEILGVVIGFLVVYLNRLEFIGISGLIVGVVGVFLMGIGVFIFVCFQRQVNEVFREKMEVLFRVFLERVREEIMERLMEGGLLKEIVEKIVEEFVQKGDVVISFFFGESDENEV